MNRTKPLLALGLLASLAVTSALAGPLDPDCTPAKAAKSAAEKATVGVGNRCDPKETVHDTAKDATDIGDRDKNKDKNKNKDKDKDKSKDKGKDDNKAWSSG
jgi:hypothetical protein